MLNVLQVSSKSVNFRRSYCRTREHRFFPVEYFHASPEEYASLRAKKMKESNTGRTCALRHVMPGRLISACGVCWQKTDVRVRFISSEKMYNVYMQQVNLICTTTKVLKATVFKLKITRLHETGMFYIGNNKKVFSFSQSFDIVKKSESKCRSSVLQC